MQAPQNELPGQRFTLGAAAYGSQYAFKEGSDSAEVKHSPNKEVPDRVYDLESYKQKTNTIFQSQDEMR